MLEKKYEEELLELRHHFHRYPELGLKEFETSAFIRDYMERLGYELRAVEPTGLIAELPALKGKKKTVVLRAEMDALPIQEKTDLPYASQNDGCMHACGHDAILASVLMVAKLVARDGEKFPVNLRILFEPAEEIGEGAKRMLAAGALEDPFADAFVMFHYACDAQMSMAVHQGQASSMIGSMEIHVHGKSSHWCEAEKGIDAIYAAAQAASAVHDANLEYTGKGKHLAGIGTVRGGEYANIIADHVVLNGNIRATREEDFYGLKSLLEKKFQEIEVKTGTKIEMLFPKDPVLAFANDDALTEKAKEVGEEIFGDRFLLEGEDELFLSGDNAYRYFEKTKGVFLVFLGGLGEQTYPLHHPKFQIDERILPLSVETLYKMIGRL